MPDIHAFDIAKTALQYKALKIVLDGIEGDDEDATEFLQTRASNLVRQLIVSSASSGEELAHKAAVLLDWITGDDMTCQLTASLCRDTVQVFPVACAYPE